MRNLLIRTFSRGPNDHPLLEVAEVLALREALLLGKQLNFSLLEIFEMRRPSFSRLMAKHNFLLHVMPFMRMFSHAKSFLPCAALLSDKMSFPDPTPPHPFISSPFAGGDSGGFWPSFWMTNEQQQQQQPDLIINPPNNPGNKGTSHIFYKTRMCAKFIEGTCRNGEHCTFAHGAKDLREPPPNWQDLIREKDRGSGVSSNWGDDQRMIHRMKICKKYYNGEECPYGDKCNFLHERPSPPMKKFKVDVVEERESSAISIGVTGDARGSGSDFDQKVFWKTKLCSKWEMGHCPFGERCHYAHGQSAPANIAVVAPLNVDGENKKISKWKVTKKINRIYADWLDDMTPPYCSPNEEKI
ncbi:hypothetical protein DH2020_038965 [Rehmannia glutinosa]|uniref:C3H1-type domain-containing protein n=1 Tax=Rehmannia glutinosa TaxID=99300 RepID=A0ABR0UYS1_REHGL